MHIEKVDCFRGWLIQAVNPICDANPQHLARYIIALVKKDKPLNELMRSCNDNLEVFLQGKTSAFVSKMFEAIASKVYESCPPVEDKELEEKCKGGDAACKGGDAARPAADSRGSQGENKPSALPSVGSKVTSDVRERRKSVQGESKHCTRVADSPPKSQTRRDELNGALSRKPESNLQGRSNDSDKSQSDDRLRSQIEREDVHERLGKGSWKRPPSPQGRVAGVSRRRSQEEEQKSQRLLEKGSVGVSNQAAAKRMSPVPLRSPEPERNVGSHQASNRGRQLNEHPHENSRISRANRPTRSPVTRRMPQTKERVGSHATSLDRTSHIRKRSRSAARSNSRSPSARSDSSRSSLESFSSKCSASKRVHVEKEPVVNSRSSTPLEEENEDRSVDMYHAVPRDGNRSAVSHPRCQDYDEKGFCVRGDRCPFDHGSDPYIVDESQFSTVLPFQGGVSVGLENGRLIQGQMRRPPIPSHPDAPVLPNVSRPPPPFLLRPMHPPPPPHYITSHGMPPPGYYQPSLSVQGGRPDVYIPPPADAYLPEPYKPKTVRGYRTAVMKPGTAAGLENSPDVWHATPDTQSSYQQQQQRFISSQVPVGRHTNLVRVPTQEDEGATEKTQVNAVTSVHAGLKRKASELDHESQPAYPATETETITPPPVKKTALDHPGVRQNSSHANKTLEIRKIPRDQNTISNINNHFSKFGTIINLQVGWEGDPQAALVSFASSAQASAAYRSQEPFLNNRFIKIFWHNSEKQQQPAVEQQQTNVASQPTIELQQQRPKRHVFPERHQLQLNNRLTKTRQQLPNLNVAAVQALSSEESKPPSKAASDATATDLRPTHDVSLTKIQRRPSKDFTAKAALTKKIEEVTQQSQLLLTKYVNEQKALFEKLEKDKATMGAEDRTSIIQTIKKLAAKIEDVKSTVSAVLKPAPVEPRPKVVHPTVPRGSLRKVNVRRFSGSGKSSPGVSASSSQLSLAQGSLFQDKQHAQKAILDTELELMTCQKEGHDADDLRKRVMALKEEATSLGIFNNSSGQGRGFVRGRGRGGHSVGRRWAVPRYRANPLTVDRRPKQLLVTGFQPEEKDELLAHITSFGALDSNSFDMTVPSLLVSFKSRIVAEKVAAEGCTFKGKNLTMVWQKSVLSELNRGTERENTGVAVKPLVHADLKINATGENMPNKNKPGHAMIPELEEDRESEETNQKFLSSVDLQNQDTAVTAEDDNSELLGLDEEDDDDDEEERSWRR